LILLLSVAGIIYGFTHFSPTEFKVVHERQPLFVKMSDGSIQNKYTLKLLNKTKDTLHIKYSISGLSHASVAGIDQVFKVKPGKVLPVTALVRQAPNKESKSSMTNFKFIATDSNDSSINVEYNTVFISP